MPQQPSSPYQPPSAASTQPETPPRNASSPRPTGVTVFGILSIVLGIFALLGGLASILFLVLALFVDLGPNPTFDIMRESLAYQVFYGVLMAGNLAFSVVLIVAGVGMLRRQPWSRRLSVIYAIYSIVAVVIGTAGQFYFVLGPALDQAGAAQATPATLIGAISGLIGGCFGLIYPIALLIYCRRPATIATFERWRR